MLTVRQALKLPSMAGATLVGGKAGLDNQIRWVHIVDIPEPSFEWAKGGELLLTSGVSLRQQPEQGGSLVNTIADRGLSGIVLSVGHGIDQVPASMRQASDERGLPLIEAPPELQFIDLTEEIFTQLVNQEYALRAQAEAIHESLMDLVLEGDSLQEVATALAKILQRSITVESETFDVLAEARAGAVDDARRLSVSAGRTSPELAERLLESGIYDRLLEERRPIHVPAMPDLGMTMERIVAPIILAHQIMGYVWIIAGDRKLTELDELAIDHAATVTALLMLKEREVESVERQLKGGLFDQLLQLEAAPDPNLLERLHKLGFQDGRPYQAMVVEGQPPAGESIITLPHKVEHWLVQAHGPVLVISRDELIRIVLQPSNSEPAASLAHRMVKRLQHPAQPLCVGLGRPVDQVQYLRRSLSEAIEALSVEMALGRIQGVADFGELGMLHWLEQLSEEVLEENKFYGLVRLLDQHDRQHNGELLTTLSVFLKTGSQRSAAAARLNIHRNTLRYRLERIEEIAGLSLDEPRIHHELLTAIKAYQLKQAR